MGARFDLTGSGTGAVKAVSDFNSALDKTEKNADKAAAASKRMTDAAQRIKESIDPTAKLDRLTQQLAEHVRAGTLTLDQATAAHAKYRQQALGAAQAVESHAEKNRSLSSSLSAVVTQYASIGAAVAVAAKAFGDVEARAQAAADRIFNAVGAFGELQQLDTAGGKQAIATARSLIRVGAVRPDNQAQAVAIASNMVNAGFDAADQGFLVNELAGGKVVAAENLDKVGGDLQKIRRNFGETDLRSVTGRILEAAGQTQADLSTTANQILNFAPLASTSGVSLNEAAAAFTVAEQNAANPASASEAMKSLFSQVYKRGLASGDLQGTLDNIRGKIGKGNAFDVLGDQNAVIGYDYLTKNRAQLDSLEVAIGAAKFAPSSVIRDDPSLGAASVRSIEEGRLAAAAEGSGIKENLFDAVRAAHNARDLKRNPFMQWGLYLADKSMDALGMEDMQLQHARDIQRKDPSFLSPETAQQLEKYFERSTKAQEEIAENTRTMKKKQTAKGSTRQE